MGNRQCVEHDLFMPVVLKDPIGRFDKYRVDPVKMKRSEALAIKDALLRHEAFNEEYSHE